MRVEWQAPLLQAFQAQAEAFHQQLTSLKEQNSSLRRELDRSKQVSDESLQQVVDLQKALGQLRMETNMPGQRCIVNVSFVLV